MHNGSISMGLWQSIESICYFFSSTSGSLLWRKINGNMPNMHPIVTPKARPCKGNKKNICEKKKKKTLNKNLEYRYYKMN